MIPQNNNPNYEPSSSPEQSPVISAALMRKATLRRSADKASIAHEKMTIGHSRGVENRVKDWSEKHDPLKWMNVESVHSQKDLESVKEQVSTDGTLKLNEILNSADSNELDHELFIDAITNPISQDIESENGELTTTDRIAEAQALVARTFDEKPFEFLPSDPVDFNGLNDDNFTLA